MSTTKSTQQAEQKKLQRFIERRHPLFEAMTAHWDFLEQTYSGGRAWFKQNIHRYLKEGDREFADRVERAYRFNHTREVVDLVDKYLFKMAISRNEEEAPESVKSFWKHATLSRQSIKEFMKHVSNRSSVLGKVWLVVDSNKTAEMRTRKEEKDADARVYAYVIKPQHFLDASFDERGEINWALVLENVRDDTDPLNSSGDVGVRYRLWTRMFSQLFVPKRQGSKVVIETQPPVEHGLGEVPIIGHDNVISEEKYTSPALIADVAYLDRACANYLSNLDAIIQDQTFSQLAMPSQGLMPGEDGYDKLIEMGTKRLFTFNGEGDGKPFYLSPDVKQAELILKVINKIINEIYHSVGLAGERTKEDNAMGIDNSSGVAKAYDFERVNSLLASKADSLELTENRLARLVALWHGEEKRVDALKKPLVHYPDSFDVRGLYDEFEIATRLALIEAPDTVRREQMDAVIEKLFPQLSEDLRAQMDKDLQSWPPEPVLEEGAAGGSGSSSTETIRKTGQATLANKMTKDTAG